MGETTVKMSQLKLRDMRIGDPEVFYPDLLAKLQPYTKNVLPDKSQLKMVESLLREDKGYAEAHSVRLTLVRNNLSPLQIEAVRRSIELIASPQLSGVPFNGIPRGGYTAGMLREMIQTGEVYNRFDGLGEDSYDAQILKILFHTAESDKFKLPVRNTNTDMQTIF